MYFNQEDGKNTKKYYISKNEDNIHSIIDVDPVIQSNKKRSKFKFLIVFALLLFPVVMYASNYYPTGKKETPAFHFININEDSSFPEHVSEILPAASETCLNDQRYKPSVVNLVIKKGDSFNNILNNLNVSKDKRRSLLLASLKNKYNIIKTFAGTKVTFDILKGFADYTFVNNLKFTLNDGDVLIFSWNNSTFSYDIEHYSNSMSYRF